MGPPVSLVGGGGLVMKSHIHRIIPTETPSVENLTVDRASYESPTSPGDVDRSTTAREFDECSTASETSSDESGSDDARSPQPRLEIENSARLTRHWAYSAIGKMRLIERDEKFDPKEIMDTLSGKMGNDTGTTSDSTEEL